MTAACGAAVLSERRRNLAREQSEEINDDRAGMQRIPVRMRGGAAAGRV
jgi:hypothetical protein